jgi:hypothetical protein
MALVRRMKAVHYHHMSGTPTHVGPLAVLSPPDAVPSERPVETRVQRLPFDSLSWENFERLCHRLTAEDADIEYCARYGRQTGSGFCRLPSGMKRKVRAAAWAIAGRDRPTEESVGHVRQRGGKSGVVEMATGHAATVAIWFGTALMVCGVSSAIGSVCM